MAEDWSPEGAVQVHIEDSIADGIKHARAKLPTGPSEAHCLLCGDEIPEPRRQAMPGAKTCVSCQSAVDGHSDGIIFRGTKGD